MSEVNFNSIFDGVSLALHAAFPDRQVHGGSVKQGLKPGDFNVLMPGANHTKEVGWRYRRAPLVDVIYYPRQGRSECHDIADQLTVLLESITTTQGDVVHATGCEWTVTDDVLHVTARYDHFARVVIESEMMESLQIEQEG